jgi:hypothetical protein
MYHRNHWGVTEDNRATVIRTVNQSRMSLVGHDNGSAALMIQSNYLQMIDLWYFYQLQ